MACLAGKEMGKLMCWPDNRGIENRLAFRIVQITFKQYKSDAESGISDRGGGTPLSRLGAISLVPEARSIAGRDFLMSVR